MEEGRMVLWQALSGSNDIFVGEEFQMAGNNQHAFDACI
jgi:hypothetical protein